MSIADEYPIPSRLMTPDDVLAVLIDQHRLGVAAGEAEPAFIERTMTVGRWIGLDELATVDDSGKFLNNLFGLNLDRATWRSVLTPKRRRTLGDVCDFIASHEVRVRCVEPVTIFGSTSLAAGAFLALRATLKDVGVDAAELRPTTKLAPFLQRHERQLVMAVSRLTPGRLPPVEIDAPIHGGLAMAAAACFAAGWVCRCAGLEMLVARLWITAAVCGALVYLGGMVPQAATRAAWLAARLP
jgi:hypothetical protein